MNLLTRLAAPGLPVNHDFVMRNGGEGISRLLGWVSVGRRLSHAASSVLLHSCD